MIYLLALISGIVISMVLTPVMVRYAPSLGLMDEPDRRKVHSQPVPRVGGIGIVIGALLPILILEPLDQLTRSYVAGSLILFVFGIWDDRQEIGHYAKFAGQLLAVCTLVFYGGLVVHSFPFLGHSSLPDYVAIPFTIVAIVGVINAVNHSDGLDGLAGGISLISFSGIALLLFLAGNEPVLIVALAVIGGLLGFLRYNTFPANIFMGDSGSQFLGFTTAFLVVMLVERVDPEFSPAAVLLLFGLPIADILVVLVRRIRSGSNWFRATRNHIHHRLLDLGFVHQQSVVIIYSVQLFFVVSAILLRHKTDWGPLIVYLVACAGIFFVVSRAEKVGYRARQLSQGPDSSLIDSKNMLRRTLVIGPRVLLSFGVPAYFIGTALWVDKIPRDFGSMSALVLLLILIETFRGNNPRSITRRALIYVIAIFVAYLGVNYPPEWWGWIQPLETVFFGVLAISFALAVRFSPRRRRIEFDPTAMDYLLVLLLIAGLIASAGNLIGNHIIVFVIEVAILFYACELLITEKREKWNILTLATIATTIIIAIRGLSPELSRLPFI